MSLPLPLSLPLTIPFPSSWSLAAANTFSLIGLPELLSEANVWRFWEAYPEHREIINTYWKQKRVINVNQVLSRDGDALLHVFQHCTQLKEVKFSIYKTHMSFDKIPGVIAEHCRMLEILDLTGVTLLEEDLDALSSLVSLKSLTIDLEANRVKGNLLDKVFLNNQQLQNINIHGIRRGTISFSNLTKSIKEIEIEAKSLRMFEDLFNNIDKWQLEKLWLYNVSLSREQTVKVSNQTTFKTLKLQSKVEKDVLDRLFSNNLNLEVVEISSPSLNTACLRSLPKTIKYLAYYIRINKTESHILIECLKTWKIESLILIYNYDNIDKIATAAPLLKNLSLHCGKVDEEGLKTLQQLKQLKTLRLFELQRDFNIALTEIMTSCLELEVLELGFLTFLLDQTFLSAVANLPVLKEIRISDYQLADYLNFTQHVSRSSSLTDAFFAYCEGFTNEAALIFIRGCIKLTHLNIGSSISLTSEVIQDVVKVLNEQPTRRHTLHLTIELAEDLPVLDLHPMLEVRIVLNADID